MGEDVYKLGEFQVKIMHDNTLCITELFFKAGSAGKYGQPWFIEDVEPHELRKLAQVIEDSKRAKDFPEDYEQKKFTDNDDVTGYIK